jgi:riboflavin kinase/FMN adenylyltransferase
VGADFRFGAGRLGDIELLRRLGPAHGFEVEPFEPVVIDGAPVSSSRVRRVIIDGDIATAARLLGRPHEVAGVVVPGDCRGRTIGYPTANLGGLRALPPATGVYACWASFGGARRMAAVNIGDRATFGRGRSVEAYILDFSGDLYGRELQLAFVARLRDDEKFDSVEALIAQIDRDVEQTRAVLSCEAAR